MTRKIRRKIVGFEINEKEAEAILKMSDVTFFECVGIDDRNNLIKRILKEFPQLNYYKYLLGEMR